MYLISFKKKYESEFELKSQNHNLAAINKLKSRYFKSNF